ncbi:hypothetical protein BD410DRAFT_793409 [Rickenella mellea]|uniref:ATP phosphoribosyltransferase n=1 Tax=Rickenella mellea TaxID=50990 RepID=A0A4Y7PTE9_9AGAM|nr:hypothetical protein BD410DRAFT_793409 [Rickenella mellea]
MTNETSITLFSIVKHQATHCEPRHAIATFLQTEAGFIKSSTLRHPNLTSHLSHHTTHRKRHSFKQLVLCQYKYPCASLVRCSAVTPGWRVPTISPLEESDPVAVSNMVGKSRAADGIDELVKAGAEDILILTLDNFRYR